MNKKSIFWIKNIFTLLIFIIPAFLVSAEKINTASNLQKLNNTSKIETIPLALQGYDIISYYKSDAAYKGSDIFQATYKGKRYLFISKEHQLLFAKTPEKYLPQFGGFCAHSASQQRIVVGDPSVYVVDQGNLYFFRNNKARNIWNKQDDDKIIKAKKHWTFTAKKLNDRLKARKLWKEKNTVELFTF